MADQRKKGVQPKTRASKSTSLPPIKIKKTSKTKKKVSKYGLGETIREFYPQISDKNLSFFVAYIENGGNATEAYLKINPGVLRTSAGVLGSNLLKGLDMDLILDLMGFNLDTVREALETLRTTDADKFLKYQSMLRGWDKHQVDISGYVQMPVINIVTQAPTINVTDE